MALERRRHQGRPAAAVVPTLWLLALCVAPLTGCGEDELPAFARPPPFDAAAWDAGTDAGPDDDDAGDPGQ